MRFVLAGDLNEATENVEDVIHVVREADGTDDFRLLIGGDASVAFENNELSARKTWSRGNASASPSR